MTEGSVVEPVVLPSLGISEAWNAGFIDVEQRPFVARDYLYASELGGAPIDIFLRLKATPVTNPPNDRAKRKMGAGVDFEYQVMRVLKRAGILKETQKRGEHQYDGMLRVSGKGDFIIGGKVDTEAAMAYINNNEDLSPNFKKGAGSVIKYLSEKYPDGIQEMPIELKSIAEFGMSMMEETKAPIKRHKLQHFHYLKTGNYPKGLLVYICRDDYRMMEFMLFNEEKIESEYKATIETISKYVLSDTMPPKEKFVTFDEVEGRFSKNLNVEYSGYLTMLYEFKEPREYGEVYSKKAGNYNRVMKRLKDGAKMTDKNNIVLEEIRADGYEPNDIVAFFKGTPVEEEENV